MVPSHKITVKSTLGLIVSYHGENVMSVLPEARPVKKMKSTPTWLDRIRGAEKTAVVQEGKRKVHYKFDNGEEMAEEYNLQTDVLVRRSWKRRDIVQRAEWEVEVGDPDPKPLALDNSGIAESGDSPYLLKRITKLDIEWRIRNLPYPLNIYSVTAKPAENCITVSTSNKKYFKKIPIPELERVGLEPQQENLKFTHKFNTLIITYKKPNEVLALEKEVLKIIKNLKVMNESDLPACQQS